MDQNKLNPGLLPGVTPSREQRVSLEQHLFCGPRTKNQMTPRFTFFPLKIESKFSYTFNMAL